MAAVCFCTGVKPYSVFGFRLSYLARLSELSTLTHVRIYDFVSRTLCFVSAPEYLLAPGLVNIDTLSHHP